MWGTTGIGYNVAEIKKRMPDAPVDSLKMIFDPAVVSKFKDCGVMMLDSATDVLPAALKYLGLDPDSKKPEDLAKAADVVKAVRPFIRKFHSSEYINALAGGNICLAFGFSGDIFQARDRAAKAKDKRDIAYAIPKRRLAALDRRRGHSEGRAEPGQCAPLPRFPARAQGRRRVERAHRLCQRQQGGVRAAAQGHLRQPADLSAGQDVRAKFYTITAGTPEQTRERTRLWTTVKTGR